ncbi:DUF6236 family protein [Paenibacillus sp. OAE614]|uniref:DUF6236 family protein n=1 Tax=Paenibacillus sp. OAE614 TaxID=2663804 RepID=UPI00178B8380
MSLGILYYPNIGLPNDIWLRKTLLYTDEISSIVPYDLTGQFDNNSELLMGEGIFKPLSPEEFLDNELYAKVFENEFSNTISTINKTSKYKLSNKNNSRKRSFIYRTKFSYQIFNMLQRNGLISKSESDWHQIDEEFAKIYLAKLAKHMANYHGYVPATNTNKNERLAFLEYDKLFFTPVGVLIHSECLPTPSAGTTIQEILQFKKKRAEDLLRFRTIIREHEQKLNKAISIDEVNLIVESYKEEIERGIKEISRLMSDQKINFRLESMKSLIDIKIPELFYVGAGISAISAPQHLKWIGLGIGISAMVGVGYIKNQINIRNQINAHGISYVYHATSRFSNNMARG